MKIVSIALGGMAGALLRFWIGIFLFDSEAVFPFPTLVVNLAGSFVLGWFVIFSAKKIKSKELIIGIQTGFLGSFTTFSTFNVEIVMLLNNGLYKTAFFYFSISVIVGLVAIVLGMKCGSAIYDKVGTVQ